MRGAQAAADQPADLVGAAAELALHRLAVAAGVGGARQHRVLRRHPAQARALAPARDALLRAGGDEHAGAAELHEAGALGVVEPAAGQGHGAELVGGAAVMSRVMAYAACQTS